MHGATMKIENVEIFTSITVTMLLQFVALCPKYFKPIFFLLAHEAAPLVIRFPTFRETWMFYLQG